VEAGPKQPADRVSLNSSTEFFDCALQDPPLPLLPPARIKDRHFGLFRLDSSVIAEAPPRPCPTQPGPAWPGPGRRESFSWQAAGR
jgi:hypothetical protein